jgi:SAM-dependent methyltransferase/uncharacterized protein YbaR (Trm112 family)
MYLTHFELMRPHCPVCRMAGRDPQPLVLEIVARQEGNDVIEGILRCTSDLCRHEYPILDGVPLIVPQLRDYVRGWVERIRGRQPFSAEIESLIGDCCGVGTSFEDERQRLSSYVWDHWGDCDTHERSAVLESPSTIRPGSVVRVLDTGLELVSEAVSALPDGYVLDLGCSVGRTSFELARRFDRPVLGIDLDLTMLRMARHIRDFGSVSYPLRRVGLAYDRRSFEVPAHILGNLQPQIDYWCCDATVLPFGDEQVACLTSLNLLDCVASPIAHLREIARVLQLQGCSVLASPYDWSAAATPIEAWLGGHSQRGESQGKSEFLVRQILTCGGHPAAVNGLQVIAERSHLPWHVRLHERAVMQYQSDLLVVQKEAGLP